MTQTGKKNLYVVMNIFLCTFLLAFQAQGQLQNNNWTFGYGARVNFSGASPVASMSSISSNEQCATVSDPVTGQLLFYTDSRNVWNANNQVMPKGVYEVVISGGNSSHKKHNHIIKL